jgi:hypothetical protein
MNTATKSSGGKIMTTCIFHNDKHPSLRIWPDGGFRCMTCGKIGWVKNHPKLLDVFNRLHPNKDQLSLW